MGAFCSYEKNTAELEAQEIKMFSLESRVMELEQKVFLNITTTSDGRMVFGNDTKSDPPPQYQYPIPPAPAPPTPPTSIIQLPPPYGYNRSAPLNTDRRQTSPHGLAKSVPDYQNALWETLSK